MSTEEFSIAVWVDGVCVLETCVAEGIKMREVKDAANYGKFLAVKQGLVLKGQPCEVDVSEDASDDWVTHKFLS